MLPISKSVTFREQSESVGCSCRIEATKMPSFRENRTFLLCAFDSGVINEEEFVLLYDLNTAKSPDLPYWNYEQFDLDNLADKVCKAKFRFYKNNVYNLMEVLRLPDQFTCYHGVKIDGSEGFCICLPLSSPGYDHPICKTRPSALYGKQFRYGLHLYSLGSFTDQP